MKSKKKSGRNTLFKKGVEYGPHRYNLRADHSDCRFGCGAEIDSRPGKKHSAPPGIDPQGLCPLNIITKSNRADKDRRGII